MHTQVPDQERQRETCEDTMCFVICVEVAEDAKRSKLDALGSWQSVCFMDGGLFT